MCEGRLLTVVSESLARVGYRFVQYSSPGEVCRRCHLYQICVESLIPGLRYRVIAVRKVKHYCPLTESRVQVVEVEPEPLQLLTEPQAAVPGTVLRYRPRTCREVSCRYYRTCTLTLPQELRVRVLRVLENVQCRYYGTLSLVEVLPLLHC